MTTVLPELVEGSSFSGTNRWKERQAFDKLRQGGVCVRPSTVNPFFTNRSP